MAEKMVDKVTRIMQHPDQIRNIAICAHIDHGKTTLSDNLLAGAGMMSEELAGKACQLDFHSDEQERGITIDTASVSMVHDIGDKEFLINLMDTPGHVDFGGDVTRAMRAVDGAVVLSCASEGIMPQTETVLKQAIRERVKPILFINKVDRLIKELQLTPEQMQARFIDIITKVNKFIQTIVEPEFADEFMLNVQTGSVAFGSAVHNWAVSIPYMKKHNVSFKDIIDAYSTDDQDKIKEIARKAPLHKVLLDAVVEHLPNPVKSSKYRIPRLWKGDEDSEEGKALINCDPKGPLYFVVVKVVIDPQAGEIATGRVFSGTVTKGTTINFLRAKQTGRVQQVYIYNGSKKEIVDNVPAGNIIGVSGLKASIPGETVTTLDLEAEPFVELRHIFDPVITKSIEAKSPADLSKLLEILRQVGKEDPSLKIEINEETGEHLMHGMGELHLEIIENRIKSEKGLEVVTSPPIVVYRETVTKESPETEGKSPNKHNKLFFIVEPLDEELREAIKKGELTNGRIKKKDKTTKAKLVELGMGSKEADHIRDIYEGNIFCF